nr:MAG TPA: hypothetical protein [Caudoviricetes sp.]
MSIYNACDRNFNGCAHCKHLHRSFLLIRLQFHLYF